MEVVNRTVLILLEVLSAAAPSTLSWELMENPVSVNTAFLWQDYINNMTIYIVDEQLSYSLCHLSPICLQILMNVVTIPTTVTSMLHVTTHMEISVVSAIQAMKGVEL